MLKMYVNPIYNSVGTNKLNVFLIQIFSALKDTRGAKASTASNMEVAT